MSPYQVLLVEDADADVVLVREALERCGLAFDLNVLDDGERAAQLVETVDANGGGAATSLPHLVLLDLNLPKQSGVQVLECIRKSTVWHDIPVVVLTSSDSPRDKSQVSSLGATEYFRKPSKLNEFMKLGPLVRKILET
jgi:CheY-like chemotaxis protein